MEKDQSDWIDPAAARRLLLDYRQTLRVKGGSEIERQIHKHAKLGISRKTIENWLNDPDSVPSPQTLKIVLRFLKTEHFQVVVPRTRDYLEADARLSRRGTALFDLYGVRDVDVVECVRMNTLIRGWWSGPLFEQATGDDQTNYLCIDPVSDHSFARMYLLMNAEHAFKGSGILFPKFVDPDGIEQFEVRLWSRPDLQENVLTIISAVHAPRQGGLLAVYKVFDQPHRTFHEPFFPADEKSVPEGVKTTIGGWVSDVIPHDAGKLPPLD